MLRLLTLLGAACVLTGLSTFAALATAESVVPDPSAQQSVLTLTAVLDRTLRDNPALAATGAELHAVEAEQRRAGRLPNPELAVSLENVAGAGPYQRTDAAEFTVELSQPLELGGKRRLRREAADLSRNLAASELSRTRAEVLATAHQRYVDVLVAQEYLALLVEQARLAEQSLAAAEERIQAGKSPLIDRLRLQGEVSLAKMTVAQAERGLVLARHALAAVWGASEADFSRVEGELGQLPDLPTLRDVDAALEQVPAAASRRLATDLRANEQAQARAGRIPDPTLTVGWRQFRESDDNALLFGVAIPLPLFDRGSDALAAASYRLSGARAREHAERGEARANLRSAWQALADARAEAAVLGEQVVPAATEGFAVADFGYRAGKFGLLELLDAQRALFEVRQRQLAAQAASHRAAIELLRQLGGEPSPSPNPQSPAL
jgi:cobalt-zinc-cadmium efflux system outer membrane protein